jgi:hypothetical protein
MDPIPELLQKIHDDLEDLMRICISTTSLNCQECEEAVDEIAHRLGVDEVHE